MLVADCIFYRHSDADLCLELPRGASDPASNAGRQAAPHDCVLQVETESGLRRWRLSGKPVFDAKGEFAIRGAGIGEMQAERIAEQIVTTVSQPYQIDETHIEIGVSVGIAFAPRDATDLQSLLRKADLALYCAKAEGKGQWRSFDKELENRSIRNSELAADMQAALDRGEMNLHYQPLVDLRTDDFGTGYSSLSYLIRFPVDKIKIDRSFVRDVSWRPECIAVIEAIMVIAGSLSIQVTVEGVETSEQAELLRSKHCHTAQGFLYSQARPASELAELFVSISRLFEEDRSARHVSAAE